MAEKTLANRVKKAVGKGLLIGALTFGLYGCGSGGNPPEPPKTLSQTLVSQIDSSTGYVGIEQDITSNDLPLQRNMTYEGNTFGINPTSISNSPFHKTFSKVLRGNYSSTVNSASGKTDTRNLTVINYEPVSNCDPITIKDKYEEKISNLENCLIDPNFEDNGNLEIISANSPDGKVNVISFNGKELILRGIPGNIGNHPIELEYGSQNGRISNSTLDVNVTEVPWQIAFYRAFEESQNVFAQDILVMEMDSQGNRVGGLVNLTNTHGQSQNLYPYYSPDGKQLTFTSNIDTKLRIYKMNADGSNVQMISPLNLDTALYPVWCSDGGIRFNYHDTQTNTQGIAYVNSDGSGFDKITEDAFIGRYSERSACSDDSSILAYVGFHGDSELYTSNSDGSNPLRLTDNAFEDFGPVFGPDGKIYFTQRTQVGESDIVRINPDGTGFEKFTIDSGKEFDITWTPNGLRALLVKGDFHIYSMDPDGSNKKQLTTSGIVNRYPNIRPWPNQP